MTYTRKEVLIDLIGYPLTNITLEKAFLKAGIDGSAVYTNEDEKSVDLAAAGLLLWLMLTPDIKEGDLSITMPDRSAFAKLYSILVEKWGEPNLLPVIPKPTVKAVSVW